MLPSGVAHPDLHSFPTRRSSDLFEVRLHLRQVEVRPRAAGDQLFRVVKEEQPEVEQRERRSEEHTSELQSQSNLVCRLLLEKKKSNAVVSSDHGSRVRRWVRCSA